MAGFIGSHLTKRIVKDGYDVTVIDNLERGKTEFLEEVKSDIKLVYYDLTDYNQVAHLFKDKDIVIHSEHILSSELLNISKPEKIFLRANNFDEVDIALYNGVYNFSSSLLETNDFLNTTELITYLRKNLGIEVNVSLESLKETQREMSDEFNW